MFLKLKTKRNGVCIVNPQSNRVRGKGGNCVSLRLGAWLMIDNKVNRDELLLSHSPQEWEQDGEGGGRALKGTLCLQPQCATIPEMPP